MKGLLSFPVFLCNLFLNRFSQISPKPNAMRYWQEQKILNFISVIVNRERRFQLLRAKVFFQELWFCQLNITMKMYKVCCYFTCHIHCGSSFFLAPCPAGQFSKTGLGPNCQYCPRDSYQGKVQQKSCTPCPNDTHTLSLGAKSLAECGGQQYNKLSRTI